MTSQVRERLIRLGHRRVTYREFAELARVFGIRPVIHGSGVTRRTLEAMRGAVFQDGNLQSAVFLMSPTHVKAVLTGFQGYREEVAALYVRRTQGTTTALTAQQRRNALHQCMTQVGVPANVQMAVMANGDEAQIMLEAAEQARTSMARVYVGLVQSALAFGIAGDRADFRSWIFCGLSGGMTSAYLTRACGV